MNSISFAVKNNLKVGHWNCNSIDKKVLILNKFIKENDFDIFCLNETKLNGGKKLEINGYKVIRKDRNRRGGGVAILIKEHFKYKELKEFENFNLELICVQVQLVKTTVHLICLYNPPNSQNNFLTSEFFAKISKLRQLIFLGDFNCHSKLWNCKKNNANGNILADLVFEHNLNVLNSPKATHIDSKTLEKSIIDLIIISNDLSDRFKFFKAFSNNYLSDHYPISTVFDIETEKTKRSRNIYHISSINWLEYQIQLDNELKTKFSTVLIDDNSITPKQHLEEIYKNFSEAMQLAESKATRTLTRRESSKTLPEHIVNLIKSRKHLFTKVNKIKKKEKASSNNKELINDIKKQINNLTALIRSEIDAIKSNEWTKFCKTISKTKKNSGAYWKKIKQISKLENKEATATKKPIVLKVNGQVIKSDVEQANVFGSKLEKIFKNENKIHFDADHYELVENFIKNNKNVLFNTRHEDAEFDESFNITELNECLKSVKKKSSPGEDKISNKNLAYLSEFGKAILLIMINISWKHSLLIDEWKTAKIKMIEKKDTDPFDPSNYRPISLLSCVSKIVEKMVKIRLIRFLEKHRIINEKQSGFREKRQTTDNLLFFAQKVFEALDENKKTCGVVFDIRKAFDKVWHNGLIYKLHHINIPNKIGKWIVSFLENRKFFVKVNNSISNVYKIETGVPQGANLSPILFTIYINDIMEVNRTVHGKVKSQLFADDLFAFNSDKNLNRLKVQMNNYLKGLQSWLNKWRLEIAANKCSFNIYCKKTPRDIKNGKFSLKIYDELIPNEIHPKYLGLTLDKKLNLNNHVEQIRKKCIRNLNILKCLSYKNWSLADDCQLNVYKCLIRSQMEYAAPLILMSQYNINRLSGVQYQALKIISKEKGQVSNEFLHDLFSIESIEDRLYNLSYKYVETAIVNGNPMIINLIDEKTFSAHETKTPLEKISIF